MEVPLDRSRGKCTKIDRSRGFTCGPQSRGINRLIAGAAAFCVMTAVADWRQEQSPIAAISERFGSR